ncbi:MAG: LysM peptidoglycan-binding domain-containing protein [Tatlockia sp.]|nr:LysM peptidoglycan-binding domain-containing protein [Tatlockia sp.]
MKFKPYAGFFLLLGFFLFSNNLHSQLAPNIWDVLRGQFSLDHNINQPEVQAQLRWFLAHPGYFQRLIQARPYIYHIVTEVKKRGLPGELALLPMIESAFDPFAYSSVGAAGLWQFMPGTGTHWGLKQDWWFDARRSIPSSTAAALNYLTFLSRYFKGNWLLAIASYDAGEGAVSRAVKAANHDYFWTLHLPNETKVYVPRLLALAEIINNPVHYQVNLPDIPHAAYFEEINVGSQIDLANAAKLAGISYKDLIKLNPGYNRWTTAPNQPFKLLIPKSKVIDFNRNLASLPTEKRVSWAQHRVSKGESIESIAQKYFTTTRLIRELNQLTSQQLIDGQNLLIPSSKNLQPSQPLCPTAAIIKDRPKSFETYKVIHIVQPGDSYKTLEKKYNLTKIDLAKWNNIDINGVLMTGTQLIIWRTIIIEGLYITKPGDTLNSIANKNFTDLKKLIQLNPGLQHNRLTPGQQLIIG